MNVHTVKSLGCIQHVFFWLLLVGMIGSWHTGSALGQPLQQIDGGLCYFPPLQCLITVGGWGDNTNWNSIKTVWALKGGQWSPLPEIPAEVTHTAMTYDPSRQLLIVVGGVYDKQATWGFDGKTWQKIAEPISSTMQGEDPEIIYDPEIQTLVMYFSGPNSSTSKTYLLQNGVWTQQSLASQPPPAIDTAFVYDPIRKEGLWFEGKETWTWNHTQWIKKNPAKNPNMSWGFFNLVYDSFRQAAIAYGKGETWSWNGQEWSQLQPSQSPSNPDRGFFAMGFDESRGVAVIWGGEEVISMDPYQSVLSDAIWEWDGVTWKVPGSTSVMDWKSF